MRDFSRGPHRLRRLVAVAWLAAGAWLATTPAAATMPEAPFGNWLTQDRDAVISIVPCGAAVCGRIAGIPLDRPDEPIPTDNHNRSQCHLTILWDGQPDGTDWKARIIDPRNGSTYQALLEVDRQGRLKVRGYLGIPLLGQTQVWTPFTAPVADDCRLPPRAP